MTPAAYFNNRHEIAPNTGFIHLGHYYPLSLATTESDRINVARPIGPGAAPHNDNGVWIRCVNPDSSHICQPEVAADQPSATTHGPRVCTFDKLRVRMVSRIGSCISHAVDS